MNGCFFNFNNSDITSYLKYVFSLFQGSKLTLESLLMVYYFFCQDIPIYLAERIYHDISHTTYVRWYSKFRSCLTNNLHSSGNALDGHIETTLQNIDEYEIDESFFSKKKGNTTRVL